jgi:hypothetical protein
MEREIELYTVYRKEDICFSPIFLGVYNSENKANIAVLQDIENRISEDDLDCSTDEAKDEQYQIHKSYLDEPTMTLIDE